MSWFYSILDKKGDEILFAKQKNDYVSDYQRISPHQIVNSMAQFVRDLLFMFYPSKVFICVFIFQKIEKFYFMFEFK